MDRNRSSWLTLPDQIVDVVCKVVLCVTCAALFAILLANVFLRYIFGSSLEWAAELPELLFAWFVMAGGVRAPSRHAHLDIGSPGHPPAGATRLPLASPRAVLSRGTYAVLAWAALDRLPTVAGERAPVLGGPGSGTYVVLLLGFVLIGLKEL